MSSAGLAVDLLSESRAALSFAFGMFWEILWALGWQFTLADFLGGPVMIVLLALLFRLFLSRRPVDQARMQAERGLRGSMERHAEMDTTLLDIAFLAVAGFLVWRFVRTGGLAMLKMMNAPADEHSHEHAG